MATRSNAPLKVYSLRTTSKRSGVYSHVPLPLGVTVMATWAPTRRRWRPVRTNRVASYDDAVLRGRAMCS